MSVTIKMIAERAGVSTGTVNRALNGKDRISESTRKKILTIADEMGYQANAAAKALGTKRKPIKIGVILFPEHYFEYDDIFPAIYHGAERAAQKYRAYGMDTKIVRMTSYSTDEQLRFIDFFIEQNISALILSPVNDKRIENKLNSLCKQGIIIITTNMDNENIDRLCFVGQNLKQSGRVAADLLYQIQSNSGSVAILGGIPQVGSAAERIYGFLSYFQTYSPDVPIHSIHEEICYPEDIYIQSCKLLDHDPNLNRFCVTTFSPRGLVRALKERGRKAYIVGFDDTAEKLALLQNREINFLIAQEPDIQGSRPLDILFDYFYNGVSPDVDKVYTRIEIKTSENIECIPYYNSTRES